MEIPAPPPVRVVSPFVRAIRTVRVIVTLLSVLLLALALEAWIRFTVLPRYDKTHPKWIETWNRLIRVWGAGTFWIPYRFLGLKVVIEGTVPASGRYVIVSNHQSSIDTPAVTSSSRS